MKGGKKGKCLWFPQVVLGFGPGAAECGAGSDGVLKAQQPEAITHVLRCDWGNHKLRLCAGEGKGKAFPSWYHHSATGCSHRNHDNWQDPPSLCNPDDEGWRRVSPAGAGVLCSRFLADGGGKRHLLRAGLLPPLVLNREFGVGFILLCFSHAACFTPQGRRASVFWSYCRTSWQDLGGEHFKYSLLICLLISPKNTPLAWGVVGLSESLAVA